MPLISSLISSSASARSPGISSLRLCYSRRSTGLWVCSLAVSETYLFLLAVQPEKVTDDFFGPQVPHIKSLDYNPKSLNLQAGRIFPVLSHWSHAATLQSWFYLLASFSVEVTEFQRGQDGSVGANWLHLTFDYLYTSIPREIRGV